MTSQVTVTIFNLKIKVIFTATKLLLPNLTFEVRITDIPHFYEMKTRLCANGSKMDEDTDFKNSFAATTNVYSFRTIVVLAAQLDL